ncbi:MAG: SPOR domain-containing protein [Acidobacteria bacterium]|nr:SPOR domain-containing protein [Acidobacteriota bacterium]
MNEQPTAGPGEDPVVHYQISITARQAATFILGLLGALGLAFFFGMKTGASAKPAPDALTRLSEASDLPVPTATEEGSTPGPRRTDPDRNLGFAPAPKSSPAAPGVPTFAPAPTATATVSEPPPPERVASKAAPTPEPVKPTMTATEPPRATPAKSAPKKDAWWVQVFASNNPASCDEVAARLKKAKLPADISVHPQRAGWFRVRVGPYADKARADAAAKKVVEADKSVKKPIVSNAP